MFGSFEHFTFSNNALRQNNNQSGKMLACLEDPQDLKALRTKKG